MHSQYMVGFNSTTKIQHGIQFEKETKDQLIEHLALYTIL